MVSRHHANDQEILFELGAPLRERSCRLGLCSDDTIMHKQKLSYLVLCHCFCLFHYFLSLIGLMKHLPKF